MFRIAARPLERVDRIAVGYDQVGVVVDVIVPWLFVA